MKKLVESWITAEREYHGNTLGAALKALNQLLGTRATHSRVSEWRRGVYHPANFFVSQVLWRTLPWALKRAGIVASPEALLRLSELLWLFEIKDGKRQRHIL